MEVWGRGFASATLSEQAIDAINDLLTKIPLVREVASHA
jgi:hypothetical protein